ncbi:MAG: carbohydrate ABC transporter substrate-binding protein [Firmicutes bacterium]|nr:carbohydrate ABC transporter substrate-binding protein [Bacillota bacterium]
MSKRGLAKLGYLLLLAIFVLGSVLSVQAKEWKGKIQISISMGASKPVWEAVVKAYMAKNPGVTVILDDKEGGSAYTDWLSNQLAGGHITADIVINNTVAQYYAEGKFVDFGEYLIQKNPYAGNKRWMDTMNPAAYRSNGPNEEIFNLNVDSVQILWFYNKDIFKKIGVEPPKDFDELVGISKKIKAAGYIPIALAGDAQSFWEMTVGWLFRIYHDQFWRDHEPLVAVRKGDWNYDPERDGTWKFDPSKIDNDLPTKIKFNPIRVAKLLKEGKIGPDSDKYRAMYRNFARLIPEYVQPGFFGTSVSQAMQYFIRGEAAMWVDGGWFGAAFDRYMKDAPRKFELGYFWSPPMTDKEVAVKYTRSLGGPNGFIGVINKSKEQNDLNMDFMMFFSSPEGQSIRYQAMMENNQSPAGPSLVYNVKMPGKWASIFSGMGYRGECDLNPLGAFNRGFNDEQESVRAWVDYAQRYFKGELTVEKFSKIMQQVMVDAIPRWLKTRGYRPDALDDPSRDPTM